MGTASHNVFSLASLERKRTRRNQKRSNPPFSKICHRFKATPSKECRWRSQQMKIRCNLLAPKVKRINGSAQSSGMIHFLIWMIRIFQARINTWTTRIVSGTVILHQRSTINQKMTRLSKNFPIWTDRATWDLLKIRVKELTMEFSLRLCLHSTCLSLAWYAHYTHLTTPTKSLYNRKEPSSGPERTSSFWTPRWPCRRRSTPNCTVRCQKMTWLPSNPKRPASSTKEPKLTFLWIQSLLRKL